MAAGQQKFECLICGASFTVLWQAGGADEIPDARAFLNRHRRCLQKVLDRGGQFARPSIWRRD